jgi:hypothetical protein
MELFMKQLLAVFSVVAIAASLMPADDAAARDGVRRPRITVSRPPPHPSERGTIYGFEPGNYVMGPTGILYGPYPPFPRHVYEIW